MTIARFFDWLLGVWLWYCLFMALAQAEYVSVLGYGVALGVFVHVYETMYGCSAHAHDPPPMCMCRASWDVDRGGYTTNPPPASRCLPLWSPEKSRFTSNETPKTLGTYGKISQLKFENTPRRYDAGL